MTEDNLQSDTNGQNGSRPSEEIAATGSNSNSSIAVPSSLKISVSESSGSKHPVAIINSNLIANCHKKLNSVNQTTTNNSNNQSTPVSESFGNLPMLEYPAMSSCDTVGFVSNSSTTSVERPRSFGRPLSAISVTVEINSGDIFGPIPNLFKWLHTQIGQIESQLTKVGHRSLTNQTTSMASHHYHHNPVNIALSKEEQNLEIIFHDGQYYFEAIRTFRVANDQNEVKRVGVVDDTLNGKETLNHATTETETETETEEIARAWLCKDIESKLILKPGNSWINGTRIYHCLMCNQFSPYSNLLLLHMVLTCPKIGDKQMSYELSSSNSSSYDFVPISTSKEQPSQRVIPKMDSTCNGNANNNCKKRSFDIMSLLENDNNNTVTKSVNDPDVDEEVSDDEDDEKIDVETLEDDTLGLIGQSYSLERFGRQTMVKPSLTSATINDNRIQRNQAMFNNNGGSGGGVQARKYVKQNKNKFGPDGAMSRPKAPRTKSAFKKLKANQQLRRQQSNNLLKNESFELIATKKRSPISKELTPLSPNHQNQNNQNRSNQNPNNNNNNNNFPTSLASLYSAHFGVVNNLAPGLASQIFANTFANFLQQDTQNSGHLGTDGPNLMVPMQCNFGPSGPLGPTNDHNNNNNSNNNSLFNSISQSNNNNGYPTVQIGQLQSTPDGASSASPFPNTSFSKPEQYGCEQVKGRGSNTTAKFHKLSANFFPNSTQNPFELSGHPISPNINQPIVGQQQSSSSFHNSPCLSDTSSRLSSSSSSSSSNSSSPSPCSLSPKSTTLEVKPTKTTVKPGQRVKVKVQSNQSSPQQQQQQPNNNSTSSGQSHLPPYLMSPPGGSTTNTTTTGSNPLIASMYLMSPSLTALSYQASNVCAYCNTAFRMTSDLVYHMRSHHKTSMRSETTASKSKRRDEPLRCNICNETFRERHHLTRHMTSHQ